MAPAFFFNSSLQAPYVNNQGQWLSNPDAVLYGISADSDYCSILLSLDSPLYVSDNKV